MFKKLLSVVLLSCVAGGAFAAPDPVEADLAASVARAVKAEDEAKDVLRAAHVRALKARIAANEMAIRRLKTRLGTTKDEDAKVAIEARIEELTDAVTAMTGEAKNKLEVTVGTPETVAEAAPAPAPVPAGAAAPAQAGAAVAGPFSHLAGIWVLDRSKRMPSAFTMVITPAGEIPTGPHATDPTKLGAFNLGVFPRLVTTREKGVYAYMYDGAITPVRIVRVSATKLRLGEDTWTRVSATALPTPEMFYEHCVRTYNGVGTIMDEAHEAELTDFIKAHPLKK